MSLFLKRLFLKFAKFKPIVRTHLEHFIKMHSTTVRTIDIGCNQGPYKPYFPNRIGVDIFKTPAVDVIADAHDLSIFEQNTFDCVLCSEVLEHLHTPIRSNS